MLTRRAAALLLAATAIFAVVGTGTARAADKVIRIGINLSLTGADADAAVRIRNGALMALDEVNAKREIPGYRLEPVILDDGTAAAGQYEPGQSAINARKMVSDKDIV